MTYLKLNSRFGIVSVLNIFNDKIKILIDNDITGTFNMDEFFSDFAPDENKKDFMRRYDEYRKSNFREKYNL